MFHEVETNHTILVGHVHAFLNKLNWRYLFIARRLLITMGHYLEAMEDNGCYLSLWFTKIEQLGAYPYSFWIEIEFECSKMSTINVSFHRLFGL